VRIIWGACGLPVQPENKPDRCGIAGIECIDIVVTRG